LIPITFAATGHASGDAATSIAATIRPEIARIALSSLADAGIFS